MIITGTFLEVADNSGAKEVKCIKVLGSTGIRYGHVGSGIIVSIRKAIPESKVKVGSVCKAIIVRTKKNIKRSDGSCIRFDDNAVILVNNQWELIGTRVFGVIPRDIRNSSYTNAASKIISLAQEVQ